MKWTISEEITKLQQLLSEIEEYDFFIYETSHIIQEYSSILKTKQKISFIGKTKDNFKNEKEKLVDQYIKIVEKYNLNNLLSSQSKKGVDKSCSLCGSTEFIINNDLDVCSGCFVEIPTIKNTTTFKDTGRVSITNKYLYIRRGHFKECMNQYQGKQNVSIPNELYLNLDKQLTSYSLVDPNTEPIKIVNNKLLIDCNRFKFISKKQILTFLKTIDEHKQYENFILIHHILTNFKPADISHLEEKFSVEFDILSDLYDSFITKYKFGEISIEEKNDIKYRLFKEMERSNFINGQLVLKQLLKKHNEPYRDEDFTEIKTADRKEYHEDVCRILFKELGWNYKE